MIKQIWFIRNERKLLNAVCFTIIGVIFLYSLLSIWAISNIEFNKLLTTTSNLKSNVLFSLMLKKYKLIILPIISLIITTIMFWLSNNVRSSQNIINQKANAIHRQIKRDLIIGTNLFITLVFGLLQVNKINVAKQTDSMGLFPIYICIVAVFIFYGIMMKKLTSLKQEA